MIALKIIVAGRVQDVGFRAAAQRQGAQLEIVGWVRNRPDGSVEIHAQGPADRIEEFVLWCHRGPPAAFVEEVTVETVKPEELHGFARR